MTEDQLKGLFGGGEAEDAPSAPTEARPRGGRRGGGRRRRRMNEEERVRAEDFVQRYTTGNPAEGFDSDEAIGYLRELRGQVPPETLQRAAAETVRNLPPEQRQAFAEMLERRRAGTGMVTVERTGEARAAEGRGDGQAGGPGMDDMLGGLLGGLLGGGMAQSMPEPQPGATSGGPGPDDMLGGLLGGLLGGGGSPATQGGGAPDSNPFDDLLGGMFGGPDQPEARQPQQSQEAQQQTGVGDIFGSPLGKAVMGGIAAFALKELMEKNK
jgi:hypothetical protein